MVLGVFYEMQLVLLVLFSVVIPVGIYLFLYREMSLSRGTVAAFAVLLLVVAAINVFLLRSLGDLAGTAGSRIAERFLSGQISLALYLFPAVFAGLAVNLLSHVLIDHLKEAERAHDSQRGLPRRFPAAVALARLRNLLAPERRIEMALLGASVAAAALVFVFDLYTGAQIRLHVLYVFPLAIVARYCSRIYWTVAVLAVTTAAQVVTFAQQEVAIASFLTDIVVAFAASILIVMLSRSSRQSYLEAVGEAATDALTGIANRRSIVASVEAEIARQRRYGGVFSLAVLDLDGFKALNDSKGHHAGDGALRLVAEILRHGTRESDSVGRLGGDEFAILMPNTQGADCAAMHADLCETVRCRMAAEGLLVTASIGCRTFASPPASASRALQEADEVMYQAKVRGGNRAEHA